MIVKTNCPIRVLDKEDHSKKNMLSFSMRREKKEDYLFYGYMDDDTLEIPNRLNSLNRINSDLFDSLDNISLTIKYLNPFCKLFEQEKIGNITR